MPTIITTRDVLHSQNPRIKQDAYITPYPLAQSILSWVYGGAIGPTMHWKLVVDAGAGTGIFGRALRWIDDDPEMTLVGVELRRSQRPAGYTNWYPKRNYLDFESRDVDLVMGNPPFVLAEAFVRHSLTLLAQGGVVCFLLPSDFAHTQTRSRGLFKTHPPAWVLSLAQRPQFKGPRGQDLGQANPNNYVVMAWTNNPPHACGPRWESLDWKE